MGIAKNPLRHAELVSASYCLKRYIQIAGQVCNDGVAEKYNFQKCPIVFLFSNAVCNMNFKKQIKHGQ